MSISIKYLQEYIRANDYRPELKEVYFMKLAEEVGELSRVMRKNLRPAGENEIKGTIDEELWDVIYYAVALANCYDIDLEKVIPLKEKINNEKYGNGVPFEAAHTHSSGAPLEAAPTHGSGAPLEAALKHGDCAPLEAAPVYTKSFWAALDRLANESKIVIDRPKGSRHPRYPHIVYPVDYGYLENTTSMDGGGIDVWRGSECAGCGGGGGDGSGGDGSDETCGGCSSDGGDGGNSANMVSVGAIVCTVDFIKRDSEIKLLIGCSDEEQRLILDMHNNSEYMKAMLIQR